MAKWTLEYHGVEKALAAWGICSDYEMKQVNKAKNAFVFRTVERFDRGGSPQFAFDEPAIVRSGRAGSGTAWSGGAIELRGWFESPTRAEGEGRENVHYELTNVWRFFERHTFQQRRKEFNGWTGGDPRLAPTFKDVFSSECYLGESPEEEIVSNGAQITEVCNWMNECYNPTKRGATVGRDDAQDLFTIGTIQPKVMHPRGRANTCFCSEAIFDVLRSSPDAVIIIDDSGARPQINVKTLAKWNYATSPYTFVDYNNLPEVTVNLSADQEKDMVMQAQDLRRLPGVLIKYKTFVQDENFFWPKLIVDKYPGGITDYTPEISAHAINLPGWSRISLRIPVQTRPLADLFSTDEETRLQWWRDHDKSLLSLRIDGTTLKIESETVEIVDDDEINLDTSLYPNELRSSLPGWANCRAMEVTVRCTQSYKKYVHPLSGPLKGPPILEQQSHAREVHCRIWVTNATTRTYTTLTHFDPGIAAPVGLAESIFRSVDALQQAGRMTFNNAQVRGDINVGCRLKAVGPTTTFTNLLVQSVTKRGHVGQLEVSFGPSAVIDADALVELALMVRWRNVQDFPSGRASGTAGGGTEVNMAADGPLENTHHGVGGQGFSAVSYPTSF